MGLTQVTDPSKYPSPSGAASEIPDYSTFSAGHPLVQQLGMALTTLGDITRSPSERNQIRTQRLQEIKDEQQAQYQQGELTNQATQNAETAVHNRATENTGQENADTAAAAERADEAAGMTKAQQENEQLFDAPAVLNALGMPELAAAATGKKVKGSDINNLRKPAEVPKANIVRSIHDPKSGKDFDTMFGPNGDFVRVLGESKPSGSAVQLTPEGLAFAADMVRNGGKAPLQGMGVGPASVAITNKLGSEGVQAGDVMQNQAKTQYGKNPAVQQQMVTAQHVLDMSDETDKIFAQIQRGNVKGINWASEGIKNAFGDATISNADTARFLLAGEAVKYVTNNGGSEKEMEAAKTLLDRNASPAQTRGALSVIKLFVNKRLGLQKKQSGASAVDLGGASGEGGGPDPNQKAVYPKQMKDKNGKVWNLGADGQYH